MIRQGCRIVGHSVSSLPTFDNASQGDPGWPRTLRLMTSLDFYQKTICDIKELYRLIDARSLLEKLCFPKIRPRGRKNSAIQRGAAFRRGRRGRQTPGSRTEKDAPPRPACQTGRTKAMPSPRPPLFSTGRKRFRRLHRQKAPAPCEHGRGGCASGRRKARKASYRDRSQFPCSSRGDWSRRRCPSGHGPPFRGCRGDRWP